MIKKSKMFTIIMYTDAGHGWAKVKRKVLENLSIAPDVSSYSYQYKDNVYLEEDCDLSLLLQRLHSDNVPGVKGCGLKTVLKRFPELSEDKEITFDEFFQICEDKKGEAKIYDDILAAKDDVLRNRQIMQNNDTV